jgi:hypothetical protein
MPHAFHHRPLARLVLVCCIHALVLSQSTASAQTDSPQAAEGDSVEPPPEAPDDQPKESALVIHQRKSLHDSLQQVERDRAQVSTTLPWIVTGAGVALIVVGALLGSEAVVGCGDDCAGASAWPAWLTVSGATLGAAGMVWVILTGRDIDRIESREYRIKTELERLDWQTAPLERTSLSPTLSLRGSF